MDFRSVGKAKVHMSEVEMSELLWQRVEEEIKRPRGVGMSECLQYWRPENPPANCAAGSPGEHPLWRQ